MKGIFCITVVILVWSTFGSEIDCDNTDSVDEEHIHYCCKHPEGQTEIVESCAKETGFKLPNAEEKNILDITADRAISATCFSDCILNKVKFLKEHKLDMLAVKEHFKNNCSNDTEYAEEMINAFDHCHGKSQESTSNFLQRHMEHRCNTYSSVILSCVVKQFFHNCPTNRWSKTQECNDALVFSKNCPDAFASL